MRSWLKTLNLKIVIALLGMGVLSAPAFGANPARPGTVNYVEGAAYLEDKQLNVHDVGSVDLDASQVLRTDAGKVEVLLTPGVFLRLGDHSAVKMISPDLTRTQVEVVQGRAAVEVDEIYPQNNLQVVVAGVPTQLMKTGYYEFDANHPTAMVFKGKAEVNVGDGKLKTVKDHHEFALAAGGPEKSVSFDSHAVEDDLYNWSSLRSQYLAEANNQIAGEYAGAAGFNPGWYWDPYGWGYTYIGLGPFASPFGWGFYPYGGLYWGGFYGGRYGYYGGGYRGRGVYGHQGFGGGRSVGGMRGGGFGGGGFGGHAGGGHR